MMYESALALVMLFMSPSWHLREAMLHSRQFDYDKSEAILSKMTPAPQDRDLYNFYRFFNAFRQHDRKNAEKWCAATEDTFDSQLPERYKILTILMKADMQAWKNDPKEAIARDMQKASERLKNNDPGKKTQKIQEDIIARLDKMIKAAEDKTIEVKMTQPSQTVQRPAEQSVAAPDTSGTGHVEAAKLQQLVKDWGRLPPRQQIQALQQLTQNMSPRHREAIENYFRNLNEKKVK